MVGKVVTSQMTEEERIAYIQKHPIKSDISNLRSRDYKWRSSKGVQSRWGSKEKASNS